ncbi:MAG: double-stranded uracil-DNA glycosylase [Thermomicrobiales bacterium]|jgi:TDG/mug DNA glycosylase family protein|nr:double-stranded uracil-DNA glycosylase [Thermomicrobiales bacterium]
MDNQGNQRRLKPILRLGLDLIVVGYNPSLPAWRTGHYYANPGNRFYRLLFESGLTPRLLRPDEDRTLADYGIGVTDLLPVPSARADQVPAAQFRAAASALLAELAALAPQAICCNGVGVYRHLFGCPSPRLGRAPDDARLGTIAVFVVPSSSGLVNGRAADRLAAWQEVARWLGRPKRGDADVDHGQSQIAPKLPVVTA